MYMYIYIYTYTYTHIHILHLQLSERGHVRALAHHLLVDARHLPLQRLHLLLDLGDALGRLPPPLLIGIGHLLLRLVRRPSRCLLCLLAAPADARRFLQPRNGVPI